MIDQAHYGGPLLFVDTYGKRTYIGHIPTEPENTMYKVYDQTGENALCVETLAEVRELTGATDEQMRRMSLYRWAVRAINGFSVINYK